MKKLTSAILATTVVLGLASCKKDVIGEGPITTETRTVQSFSGIDLRMNGIVYYTKDAVTKVEITAKESIHSMLETSVSDNKLVIRYRNGKTYDADESIRINVSAPDLTSFQLNSSGSIYALNEFQPASLYLRSAGSGNITLQRVVTNSVEAESKVSGHISIANGSTVTAKLTTDGSGKIDLSGMSARSVSAHTIGSGDIRLRVSDNLNVNIDGSGSVYFTGSPYLSTHISGTGRLVRL